MFLLVFPCFLEGESNIFQTQRRRDTEVFFLRTRNARKKRRPSFILYFPCSDKIFAPQRLCVQLIIRCFRHLEKPIKTKENMRKHFVFICFYWFSPVFQKAKANSKSVYSVSSVFMFILTTDIQDFRDINHERKRAYL